MPVFDRDPLPWEPVALPTPLGVVRVRRYLPADATAAVAMVGGVGGGFDTPARDLYPRLAEDLAALGVGAMRVRFRDPRSMSDAVQDLRAALTSLRDAGVRRTALVGHSFGGAVVIRTALEDPSVVGVVTLATQSHGTEEVHRLGRPLLVIHGDADPVLPWAASSDVARRAGSHAELHLLEGDGHDLLEHRALLRALVARWLQERLAPPAEGPRRP